MVDPYADLHHVRGRRRPLAVAEEQATFVRWAKDHGRVFEQPRDGAGGSLKTSGLGEELGPILRTNDEAVLSGSARR